MKAATTPEDHLALADKEYASAIQCEHDMFDHAVEFGQWLLKQTDYRRKQLANRKKDTISFSDQLKYITLASNIDMAREIFEADEPLDRSIEDTADEILIRQANINLTKEKQQ